jgi:hypothetical protein
MANFARRRRSCLPSNRFVPFTHLKPSFVSALFCDIAALTLLTSRVWSGKKPAEAKKPAGMSDISRLGQNGEEHQRNL